MTLFICILYLPGLDLVLLLYCFALLRNLVLLLYCFAHLYLIRHSCYARFYNFLVYLIQKVLYYEYWSMFYVNQSLNRLKYLKYLKHLKYFEYLEQSKCVDYLKYFPFWLMYLIFRPLNPNFYLACLKDF